MNSYQSLINVPDDVPYDEKNYHMSLKILLTLTNYACDFLLLISCIIDM